MFIRHHIILNISLYTPVTVTRVPVWSLTLNTYVQKTLVFILYAVCVYKYIYSEALIFDWNWM